MLACANPNIHWQLPLVIISYNLDIESSLACILLIPNLKSSYPRCHARIEWKIVLGLRFRIDVFYYDIDRLSGVGLVQVRVADEVGVLKHLRWFKRAREQLLGAQRLRFVQFGGCKA